MRHFGWDCNPETVGDIDPFWIQAAMWMQEIDADPAIKRAEKWDEDRKAKKQERKARRRRG